MFDFISNFFDLLITQPLAFVYRLMYTFTGNYGLALILFTIITKFVLLPLNIKSKRGMRAQQAIAPKMKELEKYKQDKQRYQQEMSKMYSENNISPLGGCLPMLLQFPLFIAIYGIATKPLSYIMRMSKDQIEAVIEWLHGQPAIIEAAKQFNFNQQIPIAETIKSYMAGLLPNFPELIKIDFNFLGLNLAAQPEISVPSLLWLMPILSGLTSFLVSYITQKTQAPKGEQPQQQGNTMKAMTYIMPLFSVWIGFSFPAGVVLYWIASNVISIGIEPLAGRWIDWRESKKPQPVLEDPAQKEKKPQLDQIKAKEEKLLREKYAERENDGPIAAEGEEREDDSADGQEENAPPPVPVADKYAAYKNRSKKKKKK